MNNEALIKKLSSLGCNFALGDDAVTADPEQVIIETLHSFWVDKKIFTMLIGLLKYRLYFLINTKRLYRLSQKLDSNTKALLFVVASKVAKHTEHPGFIELRSKLKKEKVTLSKCPPNYTDQFFIGRRGIDADFKKVNVTVARFFDDQLPKKFKPLRKIYAENLWLKLRAIAGPEYRADVIYLWLSGKYTNQLELSKTLGCNKSSISRIWSSVSNMDDLAYSIKGHV